MRPSQVDKDLTLQQFNRSSINANASGPTDVNTTLGGDTYPKWRIRWGYILDLCCHLQVGGALLKRLHLYSIINLRIISFFEMGHSQPIFLYFCLFYLNVQLVDKICQCWDSNLGSLVSEVSALPTEPPQLPYELFLSWHRVSVIA